MKKLIIIAVVAFLVFSGALGTIIGMVNTPERVAANALSNAFEDLAERNELAPLTKILSGGSVALSIEDDGLYELMGVEGDCEIGGKLYFSEDAFMLDELLISLDDKSLSGSLYFSEDLIYVTNEEILDGSWGIKRGELVENWEDSLFAPDSDSDVALDEDTFALVGEVLKALDEEVDKELMKDMEKLAERYTKKAWKLICEHATFESDTESVRLNGERKNARVITITVDGEATAAIMEEMCNYILDDDKLVKLVEKYGDRFATILEDQFDIDDVVEAFEDALKELEDNMDEMIDSIEDTMEDELVVTVVTSTMSSKLLKFSVSYDRTDYVTVEFGHDGVRDTECISVDIYEGAEIVYEITENTKDDLEAELSVNDTTIAVLAIDKDKDEYELELVDLCIIEGVLESKSDVTRLTIDTVKVGEEKYDDLGIVLTLDEKDKMPSPAKNVQPILALTMEDIEEWGERLEEFAGDMSGVALPDVPNVDVPSGENPGVAVRTISGTYYNYDGAWLTFYDDGSVVYEDDSERTWGNYEINGNVIALYFITSDDSHAAALWGEWDIDSDDSVIHTSLSTFVRQ